MGESPSQSTAASAANSTSALSTAPNKLVNNPSALLALLTRLKTANDNVAFRTTGGLRVMVRNDPEADADDFMFDVSVVVEDELPCIVKAIKNEIDIMEDDAGVIVVEEYTFGRSDGESLKGAMDFLNVVNMWTVCPCGEYLVKDKYHDPESNMCYYCELTRGTAAEGQVYCPICMTDGYERWMVATECCKQKMHKRCRENCITTSHLRNSDSPKCPLCRAGWV